jgi:hypothetical protein
MIDNELINNNKLSINVVDQTLNIDGLYVSGSCSFEIQNPLVLIVLDKNVKQFDTNILQVIQIGKQFKSMQPCVSFIESEDEKKFQIKIDGTVFSGVRKHTNSLNIILRCKTNVNFIVYDNTIEIAIPKNKNKECKKFVPIILNDSYIKIRDTVYIYCDINFYDGKLHIEDRNIEYCFKGIREFSNLSSDKILYHFLVPYNKNDKIERETHSNTQTIMVRTKSMKFVASYSKYDGGRYIIDNGRIQIVFAENEVIITITIQLYKKKKQTYEIYLDYYGIVLQLCKESEKQLRCFYKDVAEFLDFNIEILTHICEESTFDLNSRQFADLIQSKFYSKQELSELMVPVPLPEVHKVIRAPEHQKKMPMDPEMLKQICADDILFCQKFGIEKRAQIFDNHLVVVGEYIRLFIPVIEIDGVFSSQKSNYGITVEGQSATITNGVLSITFDFDSDVRDRIIIQNTENKEKSVMLRVSKSMFGDEEDIDGLFVAGLFPHEEYNMSPKTIETITKINETIYYMQKLWERWKRGKILNRVGYESDWQDHKYLVIDLPPQKYKTYQEKKHPEQSNTFKDKMKKKLEYASEEEYEEHIPAVKIVDKTKEKKEDHFVIHAGIENDVGEVYDDDEGWVIDKKSLQYRDGYIKFNLYFENDIFPIETGYVVMVGDAMYSFEYKERCVFIKCDNYSIKVDRGAMYVQGSAINYTVKVNRSVTFEVEDIDRLYRISNKSDFRAYLKTRGHVY